MVHASSAGATPATDTSGVCSREQARAIMVEHLAILVVREHRRRLAADREDRPAGGSESQHDLNE